MNTTGLLEMIKNGENSGVEFKRDTIENRALAKELVALANFEGGRVLLGVEDNGAVSGVTRSNLEEWVMTACRDKVRPEVIPYFEVIKDVEPGRDVGVVHVSRGWAAHHVWHDQYRTWYIRVGTLSRECSQEELERLFQQRGGFRAELRPVSGTTADHLDLRRLRDYFQRVREQDAPEDEDRAGWELLLTNTEIMVEDGGRLMVTMAGVLLFGLNPNRFLPHAGVDAVAYPGKEKDYAATARQTIRGPLVPLVGGETLIETGLVEQVIDFVRRNTGTTSRLDDGRRIDVPVYPDDVIREAVVNAVVHRDYLLSSTDIELSIYPDRLELISPGRLPNGITPARMKTGCRAARNQLLKDVMRDYGYLEHIGMDVPRKIVKGMLAHNGTEPELIEDGERFVVRLLR